MRTRRTRCPSDTALGLATAYGHYLRSDHALQAVQSGLDRSTALLAHQRALQTVLSQIAVESAVLQPILHIAAEMAVAGTGCPPQAIIPSVSDGLQTALEARIDANQLALDVQGGALETAYAEWRQHLLVLMANIRGRARLMLQRTKAFDRDTEWSNVSVRYRLLFSKAIGREGACCLLRQVDEIAQPLLEMNDYMANSLGRFYDNFFVIMHTRDDRTVLGALKGLADALIADQPIHREVLVEKGGWMDGEKAFQLTSKSKQEVVLATDVYPGMQRLMVTVPNLIADPTMDPWAMIAGFKTEVVPTAMPDRQGHQTHTFAAVRPSELGSIAASIEEAMEIMAHYERVLTRRIEQRTNLEQKSEVMLKRLMIDFTQQYFNLYFAVHIECLDWIGEILDRTDLTTKAV